MSGDQESMGTPKRTRVSSLDQLRRLPAVFGILDIELYLGMERQRAGLYCHRWAELGLAQALGPKAGIYYNLIVDPTGPDTRIPEAVNKLLRLPVVETGVAVLHSHGWTTQRGNALELVVPVCRGRTYVAKIKQALLVPRYRSWFIAMNDGAEMGGRGFRAARPEFAMADMLLSMDLALASGRMLWHPERLPGGLDLSDFEIPGQAAYDSVVAAMRQLGADDDKIERLLDGIEVTEPSVGVVY